MSDKHTGLERDSMAIKGVRSELRLEGGRIRIEKHSTLQATPTAVEFEVRTVRGSTVEMPKFGGRGWFHIATVNGSPAPVGEMSASGDPYALPITKGQVGHCRKLGKLIDKHIKERGMPADVGPNQGRYTSGVVVSTPSRPVTAPMVTLPEATGTANPVVAAEPPTQAAPKRPAAKKATAKTTAAKKTAVKKATAKKTAAKKATAKTASKAAGRSAIASELVAHLRELGELHAAGVLDAGEFAAAKAKILG